MSEILTNYIQSVEKPFQDDEFGPGYRCSATLVDGSYLPCVMLRPTDKIVDLAMQRVVDEGTGDGILGDSPDPGRAMFAHFVTGGNRVNAYDIKSVQLSPYAIPVDLLQRIEGETFMAWTGWVFEMADGQQFSYGSPFLFQFFQLPEKYSFQDVRKVHNHSYVNEHGDLKSITEDLDAFITWRDQHEDTALYRERPYFDCFVESMETDP